MKRAQYEAMARVEDSHFWFAGKRAYIKVLCDRFRLGGRILDVGCGTGGMTVYLASWGRVTGLEKSSVARAYAQRRGLTVLPGSANKLPFAERTFDLVTLFDVLYHKSVDERHTLAEVHRVLKPGGYVLITDCAIPWLWGPHDEAMGAKRRYFKHELKKMVEDAGFIVRRSSYIFFFTFPLFVAARLFARVLPSKHFVSIPHFAVNRILFSIIKLEAVFLQWVNFPIGSSVLLLGRKR